MGIFSFIIGTIVLIFAAQVVTLPLTEYLLTTGRGFGSEQTTYTVVDVGVMGVLGFALGAAFHTPFIGIVLGPRGWGGMLAFIAASFLGAHF